EVWILKIEVWTFPEIWRLGFGSSIAVLGVLGVICRQIAIVRRRDRATRNGFHIAAGTDPFGAQRRQTLRNIAVKIRIAPRSAGVVNAHRLVYLNLATHRFCWRERDFAKGHANV